MKQLSILKKYGIKTEYILILGAAIAISLFAISYAEKKSHMIETPTALEVMNISNNSVDIYWKSEDSSLQTIVYKEKSSTGTFDKSINIRPDLYDNNTNKYIYSVTIEGLNDNTDYTYRIISTNHTYGDFTFKTHKVDDQINLPTVYDGTTGKHRLIMVEVGSDKYMVDTEDHGTYAFNTNGKTPTMVEYANYTSNEVLAATNKSPQNVNVTLFGDQFTTEGNYENLAALYTNSNKKITYTKDDIENAINRAKNISSTTATDIAKKVALTYITNRGLGEFVTDTNGNTIFSLNDEGKALFNTLVGKMGQTLLLAASLNKCSANDSACINDASEDFAELISKLTTVLQETTVSYLDVFGKNGQFEGGSNENRATNGEQFVRMCYQKDHCVQATCTEKSVCQTSATTHTGDTFIEKIAEDVSSVIEDYKDPTCITKDCADEKPVPDCCKSTVNESDGCILNGSDPSTVMEYPAVSGNYQCPVDFKEGTEHLLANGDTGYQKGIHYCYGKEVADKEGVQRGTPAVKFEGKESVTISLDQTSNNTITFTKGMMCVYDSLADFEEKFAYSDEFIAGDNLDGIGGGFADEKKYGPGEIATGDGSYTDSSGKECPCKKGDTIPDDAQTPYYGGGTTTPTTTTTEPTVEDPTVEDNPDYNPDYYCYQYETQIEVTDEAMPCSFEDGCACIYPEKTTYSDCYDCKSDSDVLYVCATNGDSCNPDGTISTWKYCYDNEKVIEIDDTDVTCDSNNGCACMSLSGKKQCAKKGEVCTSDSGKGNINTDDTKTTLEVGSTTETDKKCKDKNGCTCNYTLPGESETTTEISYGEVCSYPDNKKTDLSITSTNPSLDCIDKDGCTCTIATSDTNRTVIEVEDGYTCTLDGNAEKTNNVCCYYEGTLGMMNSTFCNKKASESSNVKTYENIEEDDCTLVKVGMSFEKGNNFFEQFNVLDSDTSTAKTARELIKNTHHKIMTVSTITSGKWSDIVKYDEEKCSESADYICGTDFELVPGSVYYVKVRTPFKYMANSLGSSIDINDKYSSLTKNISGWNLLPSDIFLKDGRSSISILNNTTHNVDQVAVWNNALSSFEYTTKDTLGEVYGSDLDIAKQVGVFVKISKK